MWIPSYMHLVRFRSFEDQVFPFREGITNLMQGLNLTDTGFKSNGAGKSSPMEGLRFALGLPVYAATLSDLVMNGCDSATVELEMVNLKLSEIMYISRTVPIKGSTTLLIKINDVDQRDKFATVPEGDKFILDKLGISSKDLLNYFIISKEKYTSFFSSSDNDKKELITRFSGAYRIEGVDKLILEDISKEKQIISNTEDELYKLSGKRDGYQEELDEGEKSIDTSELDNKISKYLEEIEELNTATEFDNKEIKKLQTLISSIKSEISTLEGSRDKIDLSKMEQELKKLKQELEEAEVLKSEIDSLLAGLVRCPNCHTEFNPAQDINIDESKLALGELTTIIEGAEDRVQKKQNAIGLKEKELKIIKQEIREKESSLSTEERKLRGLNSQVAENGAEIKRIERRIEGVKEDIENLKNTATSTRRKDLEEKISAINQQISELDDNISVHQQKIEKLNQWIIRFTRFRSHLANKSLSSIQGYANLYLERMGTNLGIRLEGYKQLKSGEIREKITPIILRNGMVEGSGSYKKFSGGERCRIDLAPTLACRHLINLAAPSGGLDLFWTDEITEGLDSVGIESLAETVNQLGITSIITSHVSHDKVYPNIITVEKVNGISKFV